MPDHRVLVVPLLTLLALLGCDSSKDDTGPADTEADTDADADADTDADTDTVFFDATGTWDAAPFTVHCDAETPSYLFLGAAVGTSINLLCTDLEAGFGVAVAMVDGSVGTYDTCSTAVGVQVTQASTSAFVACVLTPPTSFEFDVTEHTVGGDDSVTWAGSFQMTADDGTHQADVSGAFRGTSVP